MPFANLWQEWTDGGCETETVAELMRPLVKKGQTPLQIRTTLVGSKAGTGSVKFTVTEMHTHMAWLRIRLAG